jgi:hypothetical protein
VRDLTLVEKLVFGTIVVCALGLGIAPGPVLDRSAGSVDALVASYHSRLAESRRLPEAPARMLRPGRRLDATQVAPRAGGRR